MTQLIPMICRDGLIIAADSMMSVLLNEGQSQTDVTNYPENKISTHQNGEILVAFSGELGLAQKFKSIVDEISQIQSFENFRSFPEKISKKMIQYLNSTGHKSHPEMNPVLGYVFNNQIYCCYFDSEYRIKFLDSGSFYAVLGTGGIQSYPFLRYLTSILCPNIPDVLPNISEGLLIIQWAMRFTIKTSSGGIGGPIRIHILRKNSKTREIKSYGPKSLDILELENLIVEAETGIIDWFNKTLKKSAFVDAPKSGLGQLI